MGRPLLKRISLVEAVISKRATAEFNRDIVAPPALTELVSCYDIIYLVNARLSSDLIFLLS